MKEFWVPMKPHDWNGLGGKSFSPDSLYHPTVKLELNIARDKNEHCLHRSTFVKAPGITYYFEGFQDVEKKRRLHRVVRVSILFWSTVHQNFRIVKNPWVIKRGQQVSKALVVVMNRMVIAEKDNPENWRLAYYNFCQTLLFILASVFSISERVSDFSLQSLRVGVVKVKS